jgi:small GTP-binding protein
MPWLNKNSHIFGIFFVSMDGSRESGEQVQLKLLIIGESGVGKSSILQRFIDNQFHGAFSSTIGIDFRAKTITVKGVDVELQIWDTAGQEKFFAITKSYYRGADGIFLVFDLSNVSTFKHVEKWVSVIRNQTRGSVPVMVIGNKKDLLSEEEVSGAGRAVSRLEEVAGELETSWFLTSASSGENIEKIFYSLCELILAEKNISASTKRTGTEKLRKFSLAARARKANCC